MALLERTLATKTLFLKYENVVIKYWLIFKDYTKVPW